MSPEEKQIENRLSILYAIQQLGKVASLDSLESLFLDAFNLSQSDWQELLHDISGSQLVKNNQKELFLTDNGMVVLSFFQDRLPLERIDQIDAWLSAQQKTTLREWQYWYDDTRQMLHMLLLEDNIRTFQMQLNCPREQYEQMDFTDNDLLLEHILTVLTQK